MKRFAYYLCLLALLLPAVPALAADYTVSFNQIVEHPALDALRQGVKDELSALSLIHI